MELSDYQLLSATNDDVVSLYAILEENAAWLKQRGIRQWTNLISARDFATDIGRGYVAKFVTEREIIGTLTLTPEQDVYWPTSNPGAVYLHRLAIAKTWKGQQLGEVALKLSEDFAKHRGYRAIRLDCINHNPVLINYYLKAGFSDLGIGIANEAVGSSNSKEFRLFEKILN